MNPQPKRIFTTQQHLTGPSADREPSGSKAQAPSPAALPVPVSRIEDSRGASSQAKQQHGGVPAPLEEPGVVVDGKIGALVNVKAAFQISTATGVSNTRFSSLRKSDIAQPKASAENTISSADTSVQPLNGHSITSSGASFRKPDKSLLHSAIITTPKSAYALKHPRPEVLSESPSKRRRAQTTAPHPLAPETFSRGFSTRLGSPPSPLSYTGILRQRSILPPRLSNSHTVATMLNRARDDSGGVTTLKLARGSVSNASPPRPISTPGSWASVDRSSTPISPEVRDKQPGLLLLGSVGVIELLEQDDRPTFIIDVANTVNYTPGGPLQIVFANASLRGHEVSVF
jgi:hypothetical protein